MRPTIAAAALLLASSANAVNLDWLTQYKQPNIHYGQLALHPYYQLTEEYDSNIYLTPASPRSSWITKNELALEADLPWRRLHDLKAGYAAEVHNYTTDARANDTVNQTAHLDYVFTGAYGLTFRAGDRYLNTRDQASSQLVERDQRWENTASTSLDYDPERGYLAGGVDASHSTHKYLGAPRARQLNRYAQRFGFNVGYKVQPKTKLYVSYHRGITHYTVQRVLPDQDKNSKTHNFGVGLSGVVAPKVTGQVEAGMAYREYDETPVGGVTRVTRNVTVATDLTYRPTTRTDVILSLSRVLQESISDSNRFYISHSAVLDVKHRLPRKFSAGVNAAFGLDKYPDTQATGTTRGDRRDDIYQGGVWVTYDIQAWLTTGLAYVYRERNSTLAGNFNYEDQRTSWNLALKF